MWRSEDLVECRLADDGSGEVSWRVNGKEARLPARNHKCFCLDVLRSLCRFLLELLDSLERHSCQRLSQTHCFFPTPFLASIEQQKGCLEMERSLLLAVDLQLLSRAGADSTCTLV